MASNPSGNNDAVNALAWQIWSAKGEPVHPQDIAARSELGSALCSGLLVEDEQGVKFSSRSAMVEAAAKHVVTSEMSDLVENPRRCFERLHDIWRSEIGEKDTVSGHVLALLHNSGRIDAFLWGQQAVESEVNVFDVLHVFEGAIPHFADASPTSIVSFFAGHHEQVKNDLAGGLVFRVLDPWFSCHTQIADEVRRLHLQNSREQSAGACRSALHGLVLSDFPSGFRLVIESAKSDEPFVSGPALHALGFLDFRDPSRSFALMEAIEVCRNIVDQPSHPSFAVTVRTLGWLVPFDEAIVDLLCQAGETRNPDALYYISEFLFQRSKSHSDRPWFGKLLELLVLANPTHKGILSNIDMVLMDWLPQDALQGAVVKFLAMWICSQDGKDIEAGALEAGFSHSVGGITDRRELLSETVTRWLVEDDRRFPLAAYTLVSHMRVHRKGPITLAQTVLDGLTNNELRFLIRRILSYLVGDEMLIPLVFSLVYTRDARDRTFGFVRQVLVSHVGYDYPTQTVEYLRTQHEVPGHGDDIRQLCSDVIGQIESRTAVLDKLPNIKELRSEFAKVRRFKKERSRQMNESYEAASKKSIWRQLATHIPLKAGRRTFQVIGNRYTDPTELKEYSHSVALPCSEITDPAGAARERLLFRKAKREDP